MKKIGPVKVGDDTHIDDDVVLGYPGKYHRDILLNGDKKKLALTVLGNNVLIRDKTVVYEDVVLEDDVQTGHHVLIREGCTVGSGSIVGSGTILEADCHIGRNVSIQSGVYLASGTVVKDDVFLGPRVCIINDKMMDSNIQSVTIDKGARIGANATIIAGVDVGENAIVGAGSVVTHDVKKGAKVYGVPACERK